MKEGEHFHSITNIDGSFACKNVCTSCLKFYSVIKKHHCEKKCHICDRQGCDLKEKIYGWDCNYSCRNTECFQTHKQKTQYMRGEKKGEDRLSRCEQYYKCKDCDKLLDTEKYSREIKWNRY